MDTESDHQDDIGSGRQADDRLIDALLNHMYDDDPAGQREQRVQRAMKAIREPVAPSPPAARGNAAGRWRVLTARRGGAWAAAALVLIAVGLWALVYSPTPAMASVAEIVSSLGRPGDRTYLIRMEELPAPSDRRPPEEDWPEDIPPPGLDGAKLSLRDGREYLLVRDDPNGDLIYDGFDGQRSWRVKDGVVAEIRDGLGAGGIPIPPLMADVPFCDLHETLRQILVDYTVEHLGQAELSDGGELLRHVRVHRKSRDVKGPETIEIWADPVSAIPRRIIFDDAKLKGNPYPCRLTLDLVSEEPFLPGWFTPAPHLSEDK
jgi:hypothetical protein